jgi:superfamily II DNA or RNA helicase
MSLRDERQSEFAKQWTECGEHGILYLCPRFGKIYTTINILEGFPSDANILIAYPDKEIEKAWKADFKKRGYKNPNVSYTTHLSMWKHEDKIYDLVIIDEIHLLSEAQIVSTKILLMLNRTVLGLTGTMSKDTESNIKYELGLGVCAHYPIELGIKEGVITDYQITVFKVPLDNIVKGAFSKPERTEKKQYESLTWVIKRKQYEGDSAMFLRLNRMRLIQNSVAKKNKTIELLRKHKDERILVFCGVTKVADSLGIPSFHSKTKDKELFQRFAQGEGNHMAVVKIGNAGTTYLPLNKVIMNSFDSNAENMAQKINRCMGMEYDTPDKKAHIYIISTTEEVEENWLRKALEFFDSDKIKYV